MSFTPIFSFGSAGDNSAGTGAAVPALNPSPVPTVVRLVGSFFTQPCALANDTGNSGDAPGPHYHAGIAIPLSGGWVTLLPLRVNTHLISLVPVRQKTSLYTVYRVGIGASFVVSCQIQDPDGNLYRRVFVGTPLILGQCSG